MTQQARVQTLTVEVERLNERTARYDYVVRVLAAPAFQDRDLQPGSGSGPWGRVYFDADNGRGMLMVHDLPSPPSDKTYQVWLNRDAKRVSAALLRTDAQGFGYTLLRVDEPIGSYQSLGITQEPEGGSPAPTGPPLIRADLQPA
jgi:hypothetical protein